MTASIGSNLKQLTVAYNRLMEREMGEIGLTKGESDVLVQIILHGRRSQRGLSRLNGITAASTSRTITNLRAKKLIVVKAATDPRKNLIDLSSKALGLKDELTTIKKRTHAQMLTGISASDQVELARLLETMTHNLSDKSLSP